MNKQQVADKMREVFEQEIMALREAGQKEYVSGDYAFDNFDRLSNDLGLDRKYILWVFVKKHLDGIISFIRGHKSQREDVRGRINDAIVYLFLLRCMIDYEDDKNPSPQAISNPNIRLVA